MSKRKHLHRYEWLSFSENEQALLEHYLASMQKAGYEVQKIARFYIRLKYKGKEARLRTVHAYRRNYFSHLRWEFEPCHVYVARARSWFNGLMIGLCCLVFGLGLYAVTHLPSWVIWRNVTLVGALLLPIFALSFALDFSGRLHDSLAKEHDWHSGLVTPRLRAAMLSLNMGMRYVLLFVFLLPTIVTELKIQVVFIICVLGISLLFSYYMPVRYRRLYYVISILVSFVICYVVNEINTHEQYYKPSLHFDDLAVLHVSDLDQPALPENGYKTMIHREANNSFLVPLTYRYEETRINLNDKQDQVHCSTVLYMTDDPTVVNYLMRDDAYREAKQLELTIGDDSVVQYVLDPTHVLIVSSYGLLDLQGSTGLYPEQQALIDEMIQAYLP